MSKKEDIMKELTEEEISEAAETEVTAETSPETDASAGAEAPTHKKKSDKDAKNELKTLKAELEAAKKESSAKKEEAEALNDKYMRALAEYDNFRRRSQKERDGIYSDAYSDAVSLILPIYDNMERAVQYADTEKMAEGMQLLLKSFNEALAKMGITEIEALGKQFDPELHNAVMHIEDESYGENEVVEVLQKGFVRDGKVIRYAMVKVAN